MHTSGDGLALLRHVLTGPQGAYTWGQVCAVLARLAEAHMLEVGVDYLRHSLAGGAHPLCSELSAWWRATLLGDGEPVVLDAGRRRLEATEAQVMGALGAWERLERVAVGLAHWQEPDATQPPEGWSPQTQPARALLEALDAVGVRLEAAETLEIWADFERFNPFAHNAFHPERAEALSPIRALMARCPKLRTLALCADSHERTSLSAQMFRVLADGRDAPRVERLVLRDVDVFGLSAATSSSAPVRARFASAWRGRWGGPQELEYVFERVPHGSALRDIAVQRLAAHAEAFVRAEELCFEEHVALFVEGDGRGWYDPDQPRLVFNRDASAHPHASLM